MTRQKPKIIIVGGGISGTMAALSALSSGASVSIFTTLPACRSRSAFISEGFNAALDSKGECDSPALHAKETMASGNILAHRESVEGMCSAAPALINYFDRMGVMFERTSDGLIELIKSAGSSKKRTALAGRSTGRQIASILDGKIRGLALKESLRLFDGWEFLSPVLDDDGNSRGIVALNTRNGEIRAFASWAVIVCTGGYEGIFGAMSLAPLSTGTALTACYLKGAKLANPDFFAGNESVYKSLGGLSAAQNHATNIPGLFCAGGAACLYHGSGLLPGNELLASAHGGEIAGRSAVQHALGKNISGKDADSSVLDAARETEENLNAQIASWQGDENARAIKRELEDQMAKCWPFDKNGARLEQAPEKIAGLKERFQRARLLDTSKWENAEIPLMRRIKLEFELAEAVISSAISRVEKKSSGERLEWAQ